MSRSLALTLFGAVLAAPASAADPAAARDAVAAAPGKVPAILFRPKGTQRCGFARVDPSGSRIAATVARSTQGCDPAMSAPRRAGK